MQHHRGRTRIVGALSVVVATLAATLVPTVAANAITGADFDPGHIISDLQFYDNAAMSEAEIQSFLEARVAPTGCVTSNCLAAFKMDTFTRAADRNICTEYTGGSQESAARIIYKVQRACGISARVLLVTLQKEQSLLTATAPTSWQMTASMGYGCPDTAPCDAQFYGFYNQVYKAAWQFKRYSTPDPWGTYQPGNRYIQYNPNPDCGGSWVNIRNNATAALYNYTPYQPNAASLANLYGSGGSCGAHGNRNFWTYYHGWFGDPEYGGLPGVTVTRFDVANRYESSTRISQEAFPSAPVPVVYLATGHNYPDALTAGAAAARQGGPLLLIDGASIRPVVDAELKRLRPQRIVVVGGPESVPESVVQALSAYSPSVTRVGGADRYEVSRSLALTMNPQGPVNEVFVATGSNYPDALGAGMAAGYRKVPIVLVPGTDTALDAATADFIRRLAPQKITIVGGPVSVSPGVEAQLKTFAATTRVNGANRYEVSTNLARNLYATQRPTTVYLATGLTYPDALAGSVLAARKSAALLVSHPYCIHPSTLSAITDFKVNSVTLLGGPVSLAANVKYMVRCW
ncbi:putative cell wall-binding protein [Microbacteriaceae bacterium SG_E_30_P1]|uniref:Cell wall-binding protein n=1 Tax=Antiquaquibacter oligotrophicus TaxID=2880260 RepID=A0ABT6KPJ9_9MICO|nr:cell wall-binding repeat-containing protein [Antiquaquibacter oligotrophicus]MDH6181721.1 putative cell wall-binding protein [Antiquaquibacter oligotrophicus]UDF12596.1 cell wall-binding repeat-containing protein [Antiquaquibacter oligotrophicus]